MRLTDNEMTVLTAICPINQAQMVKGDLGQTYTDVDELAEATGKTKRSVKGILASLSKKGLVDAAGEGGERGELTLQSLSDEGCDFLMSLDDEPRTFGTQKQLANYLYSRKGAVFASMPIVGGSVTLKVVKLELWNQLIANPDASTSIRVDDCENGDFLLYSPVN
ncbi:helix-turn-helix domain-containing protein [Ruegeria lacuscaerulensis]|uniref:hypothetical protein n=1 Tax=Ruegeria lacuscaerulensis TaxID=55218 RepID=UPI00147EC32E|nr:hypothetical protein [Ruegeria lacuscaerulensis]